MENDMLPVAWFVLIGFGLGVYVILDGFSLGIGILFPFFRNDAQRTIMLKSVKPFWDGNQTWLVLSAAALYGVFPLVYASLLPATYLPIILMLICLFFRGMTFEFRHKAESHRAFDIGFAVAAILVAFLQGMIVGSVLAGLVTTDGNLAESAFPWFSPFGLVTGVALVVGYALLGAAWLVMKTTGDLQGRLYRLLGPLTGGLLGCMAVVGVLTPVVNDHIAERWLTRPYVLWVGLAAIVAMVLAGGIVRSAGRRRENAIFLQAAALFGLGLVVLVASLYPIMIPPDITIWDASSHRSSQIFLFVGYVVLVPLTLGYTAYSYWLFRGKVGEGEA